MKSSLRRSLTLTIIPIFLITLLASFSPKEKSTQSTTGGEMTFTVRTVTDNGNYSPRHVLAIWIEDANGFVKTRKAMANSRKQYLYTWRAASDYNIVDAISGSTLNSHQTHTITWDCKDLSGNLVPDGDYTVYVEFTEKHAQGPLFSINFTKGATAQNFTPADESNFKDMALTFEPLVADYTYVMNELEVSFTSTSIGADSYLWNFGDGSTSTDANPIHTYAATGDYLVSLQVTSGGNDVSYEETINITSTSVEETSLSRSLVYPNPTKDVINIENARSFTNATYTLYAINGTVIASGNLSGKNQQVIDLSDETTGVYYLNILSDDGNMTRKIVKN